MIHCEIAKTTAASMRLTKQETSTRNCRYELIGTIYEIAGKLVRGSLARSTLIHAVKKREDVTGRWDGHQKTNEDIGLTYVFGPKGSPSSQTQYRKVMKVADARDVARDKQAFVDWLIEVGGFEAAAKLEKDEEAQKISLEEKLTSLRNELSDDLRAVEMEIELPEPLFGESLTSRVGQLTYIQLDEGSAGGRHRVLLLPPNVNVSAAIRGLEGLKKERGKAEMTFAMDGLKDDQEKEKIIRPAFREFFNRRKAEQVLDGSFRDWYVCDQAKEMRSLAKAKASHRKPFSMDDIEARI